MYQITVISNWSLDQKDPTILWLNFYFQKWLKFDFYEISKSNNPIKLLIINQLLIAYINYFMNTVENLYCYITRLEFEKKRTSVFELFFLQNWHWLQCKHSFSNDCTPNIWKKTDCRRKEKQKEVEISTDNLCMERSKNLPDSDWSLVLTLAFFIMTYKVSKKYIIYLRNSADAKVFWIRN